MIGETHKLVFRHIFERTLQHSPEARVQSADVLLNLLTVEGDVVGEKAGN